MAIAINRDRLSKAVATTNEKHPELSGLALSLEITLEILRRTNELHETLGMKHHVALREAAAGQFGIREARAAFYRKAVNQYWTDTRMERRRDEELDSRILTQLH